MIRVALYPKRVGTARGAMSRFHAQTGRTSKHSTGVYESNRTTHLPYPITTYGNRPKRALQNPVQCLPKTPILPGRLGTVRLVRVRVVSRP